MINPKCQECGALQKKKDLKSGICWKCKTELKLPNEACCPKCSGTNFKYRNKFVTGGNEMVCKDCGHKMSMKDYNEAFQIDVKKIESVNPKCPNTECEYHTDPPYPQVAFAINVLEQGLMGKVFKSEAVNMISCVKCGHIVGVASKGG